MLPSVPVTVTAVALAAVTVKVDELPAAIEVGLAVMLTVGVAVAVGVLLKWAPPHPVNTRRSGNMNTIAKGEEILLRNWWAHVFITVFLLNSSERAMPA